VITEEAGLRPSPARVRETLFNWLQPYIAGAHCLDLFAGSGALGFEALSRGAASVTMVDKSRTCIETLKRQAQTLEAEDLHIVEEEAMAYLDTSSRKFDIVFLDPPFSKNLLPGACESLLNRGHLGLDAFVYIESDNKITSAEQLKVSKQGRAGKVHYSLLQNRSGRKTEK
jgi:16S rRNA (guanine966-N2)-methyltransferase